MKTNSLIQLILPSLIVFLFLSCQTQPPVSQEGTEAPAVSESGDLDTNFTTQSLLLHPDFQYDVLFNRGDIVVKPNGAPGRAKGSFDFMAYIPIEGSSEHGWLWVNHETAYPDLLMGDGGGASLLEVKLENGHWTTKGKFAVDFSNVGGTIKNCLGGITPWGTILTSEEFDPMNNLELRNSGYIDTADWGGKRRWENFGWMVEVDPLTRKAIKKHIGMGRFMHEGALCMPDGKTVYLMDDEAPGVLFKFISNEQGNYDNGQLFAYRQSEDLESGEWLALPMDYESLLFARKTALEMGATAFIRLEDFEPVGDGTFVMTETGRDTCDLSMVTQLGGQVAQHLERFHIGNGLYSDFHGRIHRFDPSNNRVSLFLEGGPSSEIPKLVLSNPDNMVVDAKRKRLIIHEDINGTSYGRNPLHASKKYNNEIYMLDLNIENPRLEDLKRIGIGPKGAETTGPCMTPDFETWFFNIQHPYPTNVPPFNRDATVAVRGL